MLLVVSPVSSMFRASDPVPPSSTSAPATPSTTPPMIAGARLPTLIVSAPKPVFKVVMSAIADCTLNTSSPEPRPISSVSTPE